MHDLHTHIKYETQEDMPRLESAIPKEESEKIAKSFIRTKQIVPAKSHPGGPTMHPLVEGLVGLLAAPIDKLRTYCEAFLEEAKSSEVDWRSVM
jgi:hypothetical protein